MTELTLTVEAVEDVVIGLLAEHLRQPPRELYTQLAAAGPELPVDSLTVMEILVRVETHCGVRVPTTAETARAFGSVRRFSRAVVNAVERNG